MQKFIEKFLVSIEKLRDKPEHVKHGVALGVAGGVTLILFLIWSFVLLPLRFEDPKIAEKQQEESPFASLTAQVSSAYKDLMNVFKESNTQNVSWQDSYNKMKSQVTSE